MLSEHFIVAVRFPLKYELLAEISNVDVVTLFDDSSNISAHSPPEFKYCQV